MNDGLNASFVRRFPNGPEIRVENMRSRAAAGITVIFGPSGAGKTTLLRCLAGLERPDEGRIHFNGEVWFDARQKISFSPRQRQLGFVPQDYALFPHLSVERNVAYGLADLPAADRRSRVTESLRWLGVEELRRRLPRELSGGQAQRVALARALARRPRLLLLDEPLSALDTPTRLRLRAELRPLLVRFGIPTLLVTHDRAEALALGDDLVVMDSGAIVQQAPVLEAFTHPANLAVAGALAVETVQPGRVVESADGLVTVAIGDRTLTALAADLPPNTREVFACIRAEDVVVVKGDAPQSSPRNCLPAVVAKLTPEGPLMRIDLDCGFALQALLTRQACAELGLREGDRVLALVKAPQVHLIART